MKGSSLFDDEKQTFDKMHNSYKNAIFEILYQMIDTDNFPLFIHIILVIIESFQVFYFTFANEFLPIWKVRDWSENFQTFFSSFLIAPYLSGTSFSTFILVLYIVMAMCALLIMMMLFLAIKVQTTNATKLSGPIVFLKVIFELYNPVLFMPILHLYMSVFYCDSSTLQHKYFSDVSCYSGTYLLHNFLAGIAIIVWISFGIFTTLTFYEARYQTNNPLCKVSGRDDLKFFTFKIILVFCFTILDVNSLRILVIIIITVFAVLQFFSFNKSAVYLHYTYSKILNGQHAIIMWTLCMIIFGMIVEDTYYEGAPYIWVFGSPLLVIIVFLRKEYRYEIMMIDSNKFDSLNQALQQVQYLTKFLNYYQNDKNISTLLDGFVEYHRTICKRDDCPCQQKNMNQKKIIKFIKGIKQNSTNLNEEYKEQYVVLVYIIERIFSLGLTKFPQCTKLRISHSLFLMEKMQQNQQALQELITAELERPYIDEQFIIFRLKKLIEEQMLENSKLTKNTSNGVDAVNELTTENHLKEMKSLIEKSTSLHIEFWSQLSEDVPDLGKVYNVGNRMIYVDNLLSDRYQKVVKMNIDVPPNLMLIYSRYLIDILYDKENAEEILDRLKNFYSINMDRGKITNNINDFPNESTALISISAEDAAFGRIVALNMQASKMFGYSKSELFNRKINSLMPNVFAQVHDLFIETYLQTFESRIINRERMIMGKSKNGYMFPFYIYVRYVPSFIHGTQFFGAMRVDKTFKNVGFMIINSTTNEIENISTTFISMFGIDINYITKRRTKVTDIIPNFMDQINDFLNKGGAEILIEFKNKDVGIKGQYNVLAAEIIFKDSKLQGYIVKIEQIRKQDYSQSMDIKTKKFNIENTKFYFQYDQANNIFLGEYSADANFQMSQISSIKQDETFDMSQQQIMNKNDDDKLSSSNQAAEEKVDYAFGIRTLRYINGQMQDIEEQKYSDSDEGNDEQEKKSQNKIDDHDNADDVEGGHANIYKSRRIFIQFLQDSKKVNQKSMICFQWSAAILMVVLFVLGLLDYLMTEQLFKNIKDAYFVMEQSNQRVALTQRIQFQVIELLRLNMISDYNETWIQTQKSNMNETIDLLAQTQSKLSLSAEMANGRQAELLNTNSIKMITREDDGRLTESYFDINQGTQQIISKALELMNTNITSFKTSNNGLFFLQHNLLNDYYLATVESAHLYTDSLISQSDTTQVTIAIFVAACVFTFLSLPWIACGFHLVSRNQEEIIMLFLEIPLVKVKTMFSKCEMFSNTLQLGEEEEAQQENEISFEENEEQEQLVQEFGRRKKRKKYKYDSREQRNFYIKFLLSIIILTGYFIAHYLIANNLQTSMQQLVQEMNSTSLASPSITFANNVFRQMVLNSTFPVENSDSTNLSSSFVQDLYSLNTNIQKDHSLNLGYHNQIYNDFFESIMKAGACSVVVDVANVNLTTCQGFLKGIVDESLALALSRHFENLRYIITLYSQVVSNTSLELPGTIYNITDDYNTNRLLSLIYTDVSAYEINTMQDTYIRSIFQELINVFNESMQQDIDTNTTTTVTILIVFLVCLMLVILLFWIPTVTKINSEVQKTSLLLSMIPLNLLQRIRAIREYLNSIHSID